MNGTFDALTDIFTSSNPTSAKYANSIRADSTRASGVTPPNYLYRRLSSEPAFTPILIGHRGPSPRKRPA